MIYSKTNWQNGDKITAAKMNNIEKGITEAEVFSASELPGSGKKLVDDRIHIAVSKKWIASEGHLSDAIRLQWIADRAKPAISWCDKAGDDKAAIIAHAMANNPDSPNHNHISIETVDKNTKELHTRFAIPFGDMVADIETRSSNFNVCDGKFRVAGEKGTKRQFIFGTIGSKKDFTDSDGNVDHAAYYVGSARFNFEIDNVAETGVSAGSNFNIVRYNNNGEAMDVVLSIVRSNGNVGVGTKEPTAKLDVNGDMLRLRSSKTPTSSTAVGDQGTICYDENYMYVCVATNSWKRTALEAF